MFQGTTNKKIIDICFAKKYHIRFLVPIKHVLLNIIQDHFLYFHYLELPHFHGMMSTFILIVPVFFLLCLMSSFISFKKKWQNMYCKKLYLLHQIYGLNNCLLKLYVLSKQQTKHCSVRISRTFHNILHRQNNLAISLIHCPWKSAYIDRIANEYKSSS